MRVYALDLVVGFCFVQGSLKVGAVCIPPMAKEAQQIQKPSLRVVVIHRNKESQLGSRNEGFDARRLALERRYHLLMNL